MNVTKYANELLTPYNQHNVKPFEDIRHAGKTFLQIISDETLGTKEFKSDNSLLNRLNERFLKTNKEEIINEKEHIKALAAAYLFNESKIIYKMDPDFLKALQDTQKLKIYPANMTHIPHPVFYIDLSGIDSIKASGVIVAVYNTIGGVSIVEEILYDEESISTAMGFKYADCECKDDILYYNYKPICTHSFSLNNEIDYIASESDVINPIILQFITYLSCDKPDIQESALSKKHKDRSKRLGKKNTEPTEYTVGTRYGDILRINKRKQQEYESAARETGSNSSKKPHVVSSHWHGYWYGENKSLYTYKWVLQYCTGNGEKDIVIHECTESDPKYSCGERILYSTLDAMGIEHTPQYYIPETGKFFDDCAIINGKKIFIEFDGEQHFKQVRNWNLQKTQQSDQEKNEYCRKNKIPLLRIRYNQIKYIPEILEETFIDIDEYLEELNPFILAENYYKNVA